MPDLTTEVETTSQEDSQKDHVLSLGILNKLKMKEEIVFSRS